MRKPHIILLIIFVVFLFFGAKTSIVFAQNCSGSYSGSDGGRYRCILQDGEYSCEAYSFNYSEPCSSGNPGGCSAARYDMEQTCSAPGGNSCTVQTLFYDQTFTTSGCGSTPSCPSGQIYCGGCIGGCRANSQSCNSWIAQECSGGGGGGGGWQGCGSCGSCPGGNPSQCVLDPSGNCLWDPGGCGGGAPPCSPSCSSPFCGQSNGCGGSCSSSDLGAAGTPTVSTPADGGIAVSNDSGQITVDWNNTALADTYRLELYTSANPDVDWTTTAGALSTAAGTGNTTRTRAFDISASTYWQSTETGAAVSGTSWIGQDFSKPKSLRKIVLKQHPSNADYRVTSLLMQHSDDGVNWATLQTIAVPNDGNANTLDLVEGDAHRYWRILANSGTASARRWLVYDLEMRTAGDPVTATVVSRNPSDYTFTPASRDYTIRVRALNTSCVASGQTSQWSPWVTFIATSPVSGQVYYDGSNTAVLSGANTCTGSGASLPATSPDETATAFAISNANYSASYPPTRSFDNNNATYWASRQLGPAVNGVSWIGQNFGATPREIRKLSVRQYPNSLNRVSAVQVEHSDDGTNWTNLQTVTLASNGNTNSYFLNASSAHQYWRLRAASGVGAGRVWAVQEIEMFEISAVDLGTLTITGRDYQQYADQVTVTPEGGYAINLPYSNTGTNQVSLIIDRASDFICSCPIGCAFSGVNAPLSNLDFYITDAREPWFQTIGGSIAAFGSEGTVLTNPVPDTCAGSPSCSPYLLTQRDAQASSSGLVLTGGGDVDLDRDTGLQTLALDEDGTGRVGKVNSRVAQETYEYFYRLYKFSANPMSDFGDTASDAQKPSAGPVNAGTNGYYHGGDLTILDPWSLATGESVVVFVAGDLYVRNTVRVELGSFLAFIVKGDIIFDADLGHADPTASTANESVAEGIYIANGILSLPSRGAAAGGDFKFVGEGTFVGWSGVELDRNYDDNVTRRTLNNTNPVEVFRYRPDFAVQAPKEMKTPRILWREVSP